jgi:hypothetical protein
MTVERGRFFRLPDGRLGVVAIGSFQKRALVPTGRVGRVPVIGLGEGEGGSIGGIVAGTPRPGDELFVRYPPEPEMASGVIYHGASDLPVS